jgi:REP element-mobilizing transposase RayT
MHLVLRSSKAVREKSFLRKSTAGRIQQILIKFSRKFGVNLLSVANVGNHLHIHLKLSNRHTYTPFIRAITSAIAMAASGTSRWCTNAEKGIKKFWDYRPFTKVVESQTYFLNLKDYVEINRFEGQGYPRSYAKAMVWMRSGRWKSASP